MISLLFLVCMAAVFFKLCIWAVKAAWGITKILFYIILAPAILIALVYAGLLGIAFGALILWGIISLFVCTP